MFVTQLRGSDSAITCPAGCKPELTWGQTLVYGSLGFVGLIIAHGLMVNSRWYKNLLKYD